MTRNPGQWAKFRPHLGIEKVNVFQLQWGFVPDPMTRGFLPPDYRYRLAQSTRHPHPPSRIPGFAPDLVLQNKRGALINQNVSMLQHRV